MLPSPDAFAFFPLPIECRYPHPILCEPSDLFVGYYPTNLTWLIPCVNWIHRVKYHPCPLMIFVIVDNLPRLRANTTWSCISCSAFPWERHTRDTSLSSLFPSTGLFDQVITFFLPLVCLTFLVI